MIIDPSILILIAILVGGGIIYDRHRRNANLKRDRIEIRQEAERNTPEVKAQAFFDNLDSIIADRISLREQAIREAKGDPQSQMVKSLDGQISMLQKAKEYQPILEVIGPGLLKTVMGFVKGFV